MQETRNKKRETIQNGRVHGFVERWLERHLLKRVDLAEGCELRDWIFYGKTKTEDCTDMKKDDINKSDTHSDYAVKSSD